MRNDENYIIDLCDAIFKTKGSRQYRFDFLRGDSGRKLPVDAFYPELNLVIEFHERQHSEAVPFFDRKPTVSGVLRGEQRRIYDQRRREILPKHHIALIEFHIDEFYTSKRRLLRSEKDTAIILKKLSEAAKKQLVGRSTQRRLNVSVDPKKKKHD